MKIEIKFPIKIIVLMGILVCSGFYSDQAAAADDKWSKKSEVNLFLDQLNNISTVAIDGEEYAFETDYTQESLAKIAPAAGIAEAGIAPSAGPLESEYERPSPVIYSIIVEDDFYLE